MKINWKMLAVAIALPFMAGFVGSAFTFQEISTWYASLSKPSFSPPNWLFGPAWTLLYLLMGISLYLVLLKKLKDKKVSYGLKLYAAQLLLNLSWSVVFFGMHNILAALINIFALWIFIFLTILQFWKIEKRAAYLLLPYLLWVSFAAVLNYGVWILNPV